VADSWRLGDFISDYLFDCRRFDVFGHHRTDLTYHRLYNVAIRKTNFFVYCFRRVKRFFGRNKIKGKKNQHNFSFLTYRSGNLIELVQWTQLRWRQKETINLSSINFFSNKTLRIFWRKFRIRIHLSHKLL
jgi:hypothetical protein